MSLTKLLIANRGEIAIRIARAAADLSLRTVAVYSADDAQSLHLRAADEAHALPGAGAPAYLDAEALIAAAKATGCDAVHPGYGFLAERADFARRCAEAGLRFVGPGVEHLALFGDKARARAAAITAGVPVIRGLDHAVTLAEARAFFGSLGPGGAMIIKAVAGGGGRGTRAVTSADEIESAYRRCQSAAKARSAGRTSTPKSSSSARATSRSRSSVTSGAPSLTSVSASAVSSVASRRSSRWRPRQAWPMISAAGSLMRLSASRREWATAISGRSSSSSTSPAARTRRHSCSSRRTRVSRSSTR